MRAMTGPSDTDTLAPQITPATDAEPARTWADDEFLAVAYEGLRTTESVVVCLGGNAGRLGECVVGTALLEGTLQALRCVGNAGVPITLVVDSGSEPLFEAACYEAHYWPRFRVVLAPPERADAVCRAEVHASGAGNVLFLGYSGARDGNPSSRVESLPLPEGAIVLSPPGRVLWLDGLFRTGVRAYASHGPRRRYADFVEDLFGLPRGAIDALHAQPRVRLASRALCGFAPVAQRLGVRSEALLVVCSFQSVVPAKCYDCWPEVVRLLSADIHARYPGALIDFVIACGPDELHQEGARRADIEADFATLQREAGAVRVLVVSPSLGDLAVLMSHAALVLANDTGPGHIAGALGIPTVTPFLPGNVYSKSVWASSLWHFGVTLEPNPYTHRDIENAVRWDNNTIISRIPPDELSGIASVLLSRELG